MKKGSLSYLENATINTIKFLIEEGSEEFKDNLCDMLNKAGLIDEFINAKVVISELIDTKLTELEEELSTSDKQELTNLAYNNLTAPGGE